MESMKTCSKSSSNEIAGVNNVVYLQNQLITLEQPAKLNRQAETVEREREEKNQSGRAASEMTYV